MHYKNILKKLGYGLTIAVFLVSSSYSSVFATGLSQEQRNAIGSGAYYFNVNEDVCQSGGSSSAPAVSSGSLETGSKVFILGDSITHRSNDAYVAVFQQKGITTTIDASDSRGLSKPGQSGNNLSGIQAISTDAADIKNASAIVVALGTNEVLTDSSIAQTITALRASNASTPIYWVDLISVNRNDSYNSSVIGPSNVALYKNASTSKYQVVPWFKTVSPNGNPQVPTAKEADPNSYIDNSDGLGVHPTSAGQTALAKLVSDSLAPGGGITASGSCCSAGSGAISALAGGTNAQKVWNFFIGKGLTPVATAGIMGNLNLESGGSNFDPAVKQGFTTNALPSGGDGRTGYGIAQWTDRGRQAGLFKLMDEANLSKYYGEGYGNPDTDKNMPPADIDALLSIELNYSWEGDSSQISGLMATLNAQPDTTTTTTYFQNTYERPASATASLGQRIGYANDFLQQFGGGSIGMGGSSSTSCGSSVLGGVASVADGLSWANQFVSDTSTKYSTNFSSLNNQSVKTDGLTSEVMYVSHHDHGPPTCWGGADCGQCTSVSGWFINNMTTVPGASDSSPSAWGNGVEVTGNLKAKGVTVGTEPRPFSIFSTNAYSSSYGHTGLVLGVLGDGAVITLENNMSDASGGGTGNLTIRQYSNIKQYFESQGGDKLEFAYTDSYMKIKPGGAQ